VEISREIEEKEEEIKRIKEEVKRLKEEIERLKVERDKEKRLKEDLIGKIDDMVRKQKESKKEEEKL